MTYPPKNEHRRCPAGEGRGIGDAFVWLDIYDSARVAYSARVAVAAVTLSLS